MKDNTSRSRGEKIDAFIELVNNSSGTETVNDIYRLIMKYDSPPKLDRNFIFDCLIEYFISVEEYEKCAKLEKKKRRKIVEREIKSRGLTIRDMMHLLTMGFPVTETVISEVLERVSKKGHEDGIIIIKKDLSDIRRDDPFTNGYLPDDLVQ